MLKLDILNRRSSDNYWCSPRVYFRKTPIYYIYIYIYINDIALSSDLFKFIIYVDDTTLSSTLNKFQYMDGQSQSQNINNELIKICNWLKANKLSLNVKTTKFMIFHMPQKKRKSPVLQIDWTNIECVNYINFLVSP